MWSACYLLPVDEKEGEVSEVEDKDISGLYPFSSVFEILIIE